MIGKREFLDHNPIMIKVSNLNQGLKLFKFFSAWLDHPYFLKFVDRICSSTSIKDNKWFIFKEKLKFLKNKI